MARSDNDIERLLKIKELLGKVDNLLSEVTEDPSVPLSKVARKYGFDYITLRRLLYAAEQVPYERDNHYIEKSHGCYGKDYLLSPEETAYIQILDIPPDKFSEFGFPEDFKETLDFVILSRLSPRESAIFRSHINGHTLSEIGEEMNLSRERIRQIIGRCIKLLRAPNSVEILRLGKKEWEREEQVKEEAREEARKEADKKFREKTMGEYWKFCTSIAELDLCARAYNALRGAEVNTIADLEEIIENNALQSIRNMGVASCEDTEKKYKEYIKKKNGSGKAA